MIPGVAAAQETSAIGGSGGGSGVAVHFDGATSLHLGTISSTDNAFFSYAGWFKTDWTQGADNIAFVFNPASLYQPGLLSFGFPTPSGLSPGFFAGSATHFYAQQVANFTSGWQCHIATCDLQHAAGSKIFKTYTGDTDSTSPGYKVVGGGTDTFAAQNVAVNGLDLWVGSDGFGDWFIGDMADLSIWPGVSFLTAGDISMTTRRLFIDSGGHRVDPSVAIAALGTPAVMLTGNSSAFASNSLGSAGALSVNAGALTDASTSPP